MDNSTYLTFLFGSIICGVVGFYVLQRGVARIKYNIALGLAVLSVGGVLCWWSLLYALVLAGFLTPETYSIFARYGIPALCVGIYFITRKTKI